MTAPLVGRSPTIAELGAAFRSGRSDPVAAVRAALDRIAEVDGVLHTFVDVLDERALAEAEERAAELAAGHDRGPLHGVPIAVKAVVDVAGALVEAGSPLRAGRRPAADAVVVARLRAAGAVVVGITRTHEWAWGITTRRPDGTGTTNPHDPDRIAGGSSGGSAAAVAAGVVPLAVGTDTAGSTRVPAACCGIYGLKPRWGLLPVDGVTPLAPSLDVVGLLAADPGDLAVALAVVAGVDGAPPGIDGIAGRRVAIAAGVAEVPLAPFVAAALDAARSGAAAAGAVVSSVAVPDGAGVRATFGPLQAPEALAVHRDVIGTWPDRADGYGADVRARLEAAGAIDDAAHATAVAAAADLRAAWDALLRTVDAVVTPVSSTVIPTVADPDHVGVGPDRVEWRASVIGWTAAQNLCGLPAVAFPAGVGPDGLPVGLQAVARDEATALAVAAALAAR